MKSFWTLLFLGLLCFAAVRATDDHDLTFEEICEKYGYPLEKYTITTDDGYILQTFRIPHGKGQNYTSGRPAVLFQHGGFDSSDALFNHGPELSPAFYLANQGFDVWIGNARGDKYSRKHQTLDPDNDAEFWDFSFVERYRDDQANIEFIRDTVGQNKIAFIGHGEGFTTMLTALTTEQANWFKQRVSVVVGLAPVSKLDNIKTTLLRALGVNDFAINIVKFFGIREWFYPNIYTRTLFVNICNYLPQICEFNLEYISDGDPEVNDRNLLRIYLGHFPGGLSVKVLDHELQIYQAERFQYFDYGAEKNIEKYGTETPPLIRVDQIRGMPIALFVGTSDLLADTRDAEWLREQLDENVVFYKTYDYGHSSFYIAKDMSYLQDLVGVLRQFTNLTTSEITEVSLKNLSG